MVDDVRPAYADDEIDLFELIETLWQQKVWIVLFTVIAAVGGGSYAFLATPTYEATVRLLPPSSKDVAELNKLGGVKYLDSANANANANANAIMVPGIGSAGAFATTNEILQSSALRRQFLAEADVSSYFNPENLPLARFWKGYSEAIVVSLPGKNSITTDIKVIADDPVVAADFANRYAVMAIDLARNRLISDFTEQLRQQLAQVEATIGSRRSTFEAEIDMELSKLREARMIAEAVGIEQERDTAVVVDGSERLMVDELRRLYRLGTVAIDAEIKALELRKKNLSLVPGLLDLQQQGAFLKSVSLDESKLQPAIVDMEALPPASPIKPKKALILALSIVLGGMVGVLFVLIRSAVRKRKANQ